MKRLLIGLIIGLVIGVATGAGISAYSTHKAPQTVSSEPTITQLLALVNAERAKYHVAPLTEDPRLDASAQMKANDEIAYNYFGHFRNGKFIGQEFIDGTGISCVLDDENLAWNTDHSTITAQEAVNWWMSSTPHRTAMLDGKYTLTGFGIVNDAVVEHFCQVR